MKHSLRTRWNRLAALAAATAFGLLALQVQAQQSSAKSLKPVTIALGTHVVNVTYPWLTLPIALGYWKDEGYDVKIVTTGGSLQGIQQMVAGGVDFAQVNSTGLIQANAENNVAVRGLRGTGVIDWGVGVPQDSSIKTAADLKGKKIGIFSLAPAACRCSRATCAPTGSIRTRTCRSSPPVQAHRRSKPSSRTACRR